MPPLPPLSHPYPPFFVFFMVVPHLSKNPSGFIQHVFPSLTPEECVCIIQPRVASGQTKYKYCKPGDTGVWLNICDVVLSTILLIVLLWIHLLLNKCLVWVCGCVWCSLWCSYGFVSLPICLKLAVGSSSGCQGGKNIQYRKCCLNTQQNNGEVLWRENRRTGEEACAWKIKMPSGSVEVTAKEIQTERGKGRMRRGRRKEMRKRVEEEGYFVWVERRPDCGWMES